MLEEYGLFSKPRCAERSEMGAPAVPAHPQTKASSRRAGPWVPAPSLPLQSRSAPFLWQEWPKEPKSNLEDFHFLVYIAASPYPFRKKYKVMLMSSFNSLQFGHRVC